MSGAWLRKKVRHPWPGGPRRLTMYLATLDCATSNPSLSSSPRMRGAPMVFAQAHKHQDGFKIEAASANPYRSKGFDKASLDATRTALIARAGEVKNTFKAFGMPNETDPTARLIAAAAGWGGLPVKDAAYISTIRPDKAASDGACASMSLRHSSTRAASSRSRPMVQIVGSRPKTSR